MIHILLLSAYLYACLYKCENIKLLNVVTRFNAAHSTNFLLVHQYVRFTIQSQSELSALLNEEDCPYHQPLPIFLFRRENINLAILQTR